MGWHLCPRLRALAVVRLFTRRLKRCWRAGQLLVLIARARWPAAGIARGRGGPPGIALGRDCPRGIARASQSRASSPVLISGAYGLAPVPTSACSGSSPIFHPSPEVVLARWAITRAYRPRPLPPAPSRARGPAPGIARARACRPTGSLPPRWDHRSPRLGSSTPFSPAPGIHLRGLVAPVHHRRRSVSVRARSQLRTPAAPPSRRETACRRPR
jgi:hypothetical protein